MTANDKSDEGCDGGYCLCCTCDAALTLEIEMANWGRRMDMDKVANAKTVAVAAWAGEMAAAAVAACPGIAGQIGIADERGDSSVDLEEN